MNFKKLGIDESILRALNEIGHTNPTLIQQKAIPVIRSGRNLMCCSQSGSGKTAAFSIPILQHMGKPQYESERPVRALILTSTREHAMQVYGSICQYSRYTGRVANVIYGGVSQIPQVEAIKRGADILVATPLRFLEFMEQGLMDIHGIEYLVIDDAHKMCDMGFLDDIMKISIKLPKKRQTLLFTQVLSSEIREFSNKILYRPVRIDTTFRKRKRCAAPRVVIKRKEQAKSNTEKRVARSATINENSTRNSFTNVSANMSTNIQKLGGKGVGRKVKRIQSQGVSKSIESRKTVSIYDEFRMDISTPRTGKLSDEAAARIRAKVQAKLKEREEVRRQAERKTVKPKKENINTSIKKSAHARRNRTRGRGNRKQNKE